MKSVRELNELKKQCALLIKKTFDGIFNKEPRMKSLGGLRGSPKIFKELKQWQRIEENY
jgi:hypothetical protein